MGIDSSDGMINRSKNDNKGEEIHFELLRIEEMEFEDSFDIIFSNSAFQWFKDPEQVLMRCHKALGDGGRIGIKLPQRRSTVLILLKQ